MRTLDFDLQLMIDLRNSDPIKWNYSALGRYFKRDHTTIMYHFRRLGMATGKQRGVEMYKLRGLETLSQYKKRQALAIIQPVSIHKYDFIFTEKLNPGKTYKEYLAEAKKRTTERNYIKTYYATRFTKKAHEKRGRGDAEGFRAVAEDFCTVPDTQDIG